MREIEVSRVIPAPLEEAFQACGDFETVADRISAIKELVLLDEGPVRSGTRFRETRVHGSREHTETMTIDDWAPPNSYSVTCDSHGTVWHTLYRFETVGGNETRVTMRMSAKAHGLMAKLMQLVMGGKMMSMIQNCISQDLDDIAAWIESDRGQKAATEGA